MYIDMHFDSLRPDYIESLPDHANSLYNAPQFYIALSAEAADSE